MQLARQILKPRSPRLGLVLERGRRHRTPGSPPRPRRPFSPLLGAGRRSATAARRRPPRSSRTVFAGGAVPIGSLDPAAVHPGHLRSPHAGDVPGIGRDSRRRRMRGEAAHRGGYVEGVRRRGFPCGAPGGRRLRPISRLAPVAGRAVGGCRAVDPPRPTPGAWFGSRPARLSPVDSGRIWSSDRGSARACPQSIQRARERAVR